jgi:hypothetical protein
MLTEDEPLPRYAFASFENCIQFAPEHLDTLRKDCETVFTARDKPDGAAYSAGQTFFLPANKEPRCALEALAMMIFHKHTEHLPQGMYDPATSGANWWTLVLDENSDNSDTADRKPSVTEAAVAAGEDDEEEGDEDEVGLHFDADYELEDQTNLLLHPRVGTVTYLSDCGAPTVIFNLKSPPMEDTQCKSLEQNIDKAWLSHPQLGKHTAFDGRLLHGAPALYFPSRQKPHKDDNDEPSAKRQKLENGSPQQQSTANGKRYTLLVNIWLNHWVMDAALLDEEVCAQLRTPWKKESNDKGSNDKGNFIQGDVKDSGNALQPFTWNKAIDFSKAPSVSTISLKPSNVDPAGEDEITLCNHHVTVFYNPLMSECHKASQLAPTVEMQLQDNTIRLRVDGPLEEEEEEGDE